MNKPHLFAILGFIVLIALVPHADSYIPPTRAYEKIYSGSNHIEAKNYLGKLNVTNGAGIAISLTNGTTAPSITITNSALVPAKSLTILSADEADATVTVANADTTIKSYGLAGNTCSSIIVEGEVELSYTTLSTLQNINLKIFDGTTQKKLFIAHAQVAANAREAISVKTSFTETTAQTLSIKQGAGATDANTSIILHSMRVYCAS